MAPFASVILEENRGTRTEGRGMATHVPYNLRMRSNCEVVKIGTG